MAHGDFRIEVKLSVPAPSSEMERARIIAKCDAEIEALRAKLAEVASNAVLVEAHSVRENSRSPRRSPPPPVEPTLRDYAAE